MMWDRVIADVQYAYTQWQSDAGHTTVRVRRNELSLSRDHAEQIVDRAYRLITAPAALESPERDRALIVTKAPHTGSDVTVTSILARCIAFGLTINYVARQAPEDADRIAHALYPDVWLNFVRLPSGNAVWSRIDSKFNNSEYAAIFGEPYSRSAVVTGHQACSDNRLSRDEFMKIWQTGRELLTRDAAVAAFGRSAANMLFGKDGANGYQWYRGPFPVGIQKIGSNLMAFSLRHERLYSGRPTIVLNGHFILLSQRFRGTNGIGATVIELGLADSPTINEIRCRLIGAADQPEECLKGTIRRDALDGFFPTDAPNDPVVPWANAVHASDGYLAGAIEAAGVLGRAKVSAMSTRLAHAGYTAVEIGSLIMKDPIVLANSDEQRLTKRTALLSRDECLARISRYFPPLSGDRSPPASAYLLAALIGGDDISRTGITSDQSHAEPDSRRPAKGSVRDCADLAQSLTKAGEAIISSGGLGLLVPLAGSGGRFGGYHLAEGQGRRLKPLLRLFDLGEHVMSSMDVRAAHARFLASMSSAPVPMLLSCSHATEPGVREWLSEIGDLNAETVRVPEMYRMRLDRSYASTAVPDISGADSILRDPEGWPLLKPSGSLGMLISACQSGALRRWRDSGVQVAVAANADDLGFRVDPRIVAMVMREPELDAVVLTTPVTWGEAPNGKLDQRGGLLRERHVSSKWSSYVEEHARPAHGQEEEHYNTNQIYFRVDSLCHLFDDVTASGLDAIRRRLPLYFESKKVNVGDDQVDALHAYQTYADILRLLPAVAALSMTRMPRRGQSWGYAPLKFERDVAAAQAVITAIDIIGDKLLLSQSLVKCVNPSDYKYTLHGESWQNPRYGGTIGKRLN